MPLLAASLADKVTLYRASIFIGIAIWAHSLIPALMLRGRDRPVEGGRSGNRALAEPLDRDHGPHSRRRRVRRPHRSCQAASPIAEAFSMEILDPGERGAMVGLRSTAQQTLSGLGAFAGSRLMASGDYVTPFVLMAGLYTASTVLFWVWFRPLGAPCLWRRCSRRAIRFVPRD